MGFLLSVATLFALTWLGARRYTRSLGHGVRLSGGGWRTIIKPARRRSAVTEPTLVAVALPVASSLEFEIRAETMLSRLAGRLGLAGDMQVGEAAFDDSVHLVSDDPRMRGLLPANTAFVDGLHALLHHLPEGFSLKLLACRGGVMRLELLGHGGVPVEHAANDAFARLTELASALPAGPSASASAPTFVRSAWLRALAFALMYNSMLHGLRVAWFDSATTIDLQALQRWGGALGLVLLAGLLATTLLLLWNSPRRHRTLAIVLIAGSIGSLGSGLLFVRDANMDFDFRPTRTVPGRVTGRVDMPTFRPAIELALEGVPAVSRRMRRVESFNYSNDTPVEADVHTGFLDLAWIGRIERTGVAPQ